MIKRWIQRIRILAVVVVIGIAGSTLAASKEPPQVLWPHSTVNAAASGADSLVDDTVLQAVSESLDRQLHVLEEQGKVPFTIKETDDSFTEDVTENGLVTMLPIIQNDECFLSHYTIHGKSFYKAVVMTQIDVNFCYYPGSGNSLRILHTIPLTGYAVIGTNGEYTSPISKQELREQFIANAKQLIRQDLQFKNKRFLKDLDFRMVTPDTYQVTRVDVSSEAARQFYGEHLAEAQALIASAFTSQYAAAHDNITMLPSVIGGKWQEDAAKKTYQLSLGDTGKYLVMERANHEITLDLSRVAAFDIPIKRETGVYKKKGYAADIQNKTERKTGTAVVQRLMLGDSNSNEVRYDLNGILAEVLTLAAKNAAAN